MGFRERQNVQVQCTKITSTFICTGPTESCWAWLSALHWEIGPLNSKSNLSC